MSTQTKTNGKIETPDFAALMPDVDQTVERARELQERLLDSAKSAAEVSLDSYEKAVQSIVDFEHNAAEKAPFGAELITAHATFLKDMTSLYTTTAREVLK
ncbi:hypothetical protein BH20ACT5_BH20ACT5_17170 [soil metagenome]